MTDPALERLDARPEVAAIAAQRAPRLWGWLFLPWFFIVSGVALCVMPLLPGASVSPGMVMLCSIFGGVWVVMGVFMRAAERARRGPVRTAAARIVGRFAEQVPGRTPYTRHHVRIRIATGAEVQLVDRRHVAGDGATDIGIARWSGDLLLAWHEVRARLPRPAPAPPGSTVALYRD